MKLLITGFDGYIGKHIVSSLKSKNIDYKKIQLNDLNTKHYSSTHLLHLQFYISKNKLKSFQKKNLNIIKKIINKCIKEKITLIFFSTCSADLKINDYTISKKKCENEIIKFSKKKGLNYKILRIYNVYSQNLNARGVIPDLIKKMRNNKKITLRYPDNVRDLIFVEDLITMINKILKIKKSGILEVGTGKGTKITQIAKAIQTQFNFNCKIINSNKRKSSKNFYSKANLKKNKSLINWYPKINLKKGLQKVYKLNKFYE